MMGGPRVVSRSMPADANLRNLNYLTLALLLLYNDVSCLCVSIPLKLYQTDQTN